MTSKRLVEVVRFIATEQCIADPSLFKAVRDSVAHDRKDRGLTAQFWGTSLERPNECFWFLLWQTRAHAAAFEEDPSYPAFAQQRQALATAPVLAFFVPMSGNPRRCLEAPVTAVDLYRLQAAAVGMQDVIQSLMYRLESMVLRGFVALSWGVAIEDGSRGAYISGWRSIEDRMRLGTPEELKVFAQDCKPVFEKFVELYFSHVHFKLHETS